MKKNRLVMIGLVGIMLAGALLVTGCDEPKPGGEDKGNGDSATQKTIVITGLDSALNGQVWVSGARGDNLDNFNREIKAYGEGTVSNGRLEVSLFEMMMIEYEDDFGWDRTDTPWTRTGSYYVVFGVQDAENVSAYFTKAKVSFTNQTTTIVFNTTIFEEIEVPQVEEDWEEDGI
ncbi:MAG: hypothetical protein LBO67_08730 [Spirochaetaceae bacterium]|jgi:hypothetical protein|nr:hypothetical protein [Spirochaetaceae bacterium]